MNYLTVEDVAQRLKMHPNTIRRAIRAGKIFASRPSTGKKAPFRIAETELERLHIQSMYGNKNGSDGSSG